MYVIVVYDIQGTQVTKIHKYLKKRINWIQNSVFEGELTHSEFVRMKGDLKKMLKKLKKVDSEREDSIICFHMPYKGVLKREVWGSEKNPIDNFI